MGAQLQAALLDALPPLQGRVRQKVVRALAARMEAFARQGASARSPLPLLLHEALVQLRTAADRLEDEGRELVRRYDAATDDDARKNVLRGHIDRTMKSAGERRKDKAALRRWMGLDTLRERLEIERQRLLVEEEVAIRILAGTLSKGDEPPQPPFELAPLGELLLERAMGTPRVPSRLAALDALRTLVVSQPAVGKAVPALAARLTALAEDGELDPFVRSAALRTLHAVDAAKALTTFRQLLFFSPGTPKAFLFRRQVLEEVAPLFADETLWPLLDELRATEPSEYVRMAIAEVAGARAAGRAVLRKLAGLDGSTEASPKVRAASVVAAFAGSEPLAVVRGVLGREQHPLVLRICCEQLSAWLERSQTHSAAELEELARLLAAARTRDGQRGDVVEAAAVAEQICHRVSDPHRRAWTAYLREVIQHIPIGGRKRVRVEPPPEGLAPLPESKAWLGAILADLSSSGFGIYAQLGRGQLTLWRGDRYARRFWRTWHELGRPAPDKRQGFIHTVGRTMVGELRAHPLRLDEITQTAVPGERVHVASEGGWSRHLPTVDDLLDLPLREGERVRLFSSHGVTTVLPPPSLARRLRNRVRLSLKYEQLSNLRLDALAGAEPRERGRFVETVRDDFGISVVFEPYQKGGPVPSKVTTLFHGGRGSGSALLGLGVAETGWLAMLTDRLADNPEYFFSPGGNGLVALSVFTAGAFTVFLGNAYHQRQRIQDARAALPLCIGGWGTRGKSGTERLKAALFSGLGFDVFAKTTGSEAMFVHAPAGTTPTEFFIFRPYDKATIWEQRDMVELGARLGVEVFLWECMALQPSFAELLQNDWMRDDWVTLTNAYPDHEDIQGPAGVNVAEVITHFMPKGRAVLTSEDQFLPLFQEAASKKGTTLIHSAAHEAELIPDEVLALFPYQEHPRNVALVAKLAEQLGVPRSYAIALMAEHVQPEIGVLKVFPPAKVRGRTLTFINGHSANERTGFLNNWRRTGLDAVDPNVHADRAVVTVINNRWDRVARSEVFARLVVEDAPADRHVLIGTNLEGLTKYIRTALDQHLERVEVVAEEDLRKPVNPAEARVSRELAKLKIPRPSVDVFLDRLERYAQGAGYAVVHTARLVESVATALSAPGETLDVGMIREELRKAFGSELAASLEKTPAVHRPDELPEVLAPATAEEVHAHALYLLARMVVHARLLRGLPREEEGLGAYHRKFRGAYRALFLEQLVVVEDSRATGDQIVDACAKAVAPGLSVSIIGAQNIKGTGLDWVYRWIALDKVSTALRSLESGNVDERLRALQTLEGFEDFGVVDAGLAQAELPRLANGSASAEERARLIRLAQKTRAVHQARLGRLHHTSRVGFTQRMANVLERTFDYLDSVRRRRLSERIIQDLVDARISHPRAALELRKVYERQKGGWLKLSRATEPADTAFSGRDALEDALRSPAGVVPRAPQHLEPGSVRSAGDDVQPPA